MGDTGQCLSVPGLTRSQLKLCYQQPDAVAVALDGLRQAAQECRRQFDGHRWNCTSTSRNNPLTGAMMRRGYKETAFVYAISSAGVAISVAKACSQGRLLNCGCDPQRYRLKTAEAVGFDKKSAYKSGNKNWKWGSCSYNLQYGIKFSRRFLDAKDKEPDIHAMINSHNNQVGRTTVSSNMDVKCKCHGMSGSCELKTCWRVTPTIRQVGKVLKDRYKKAVLVEQSNLGNGNSNNNRISTMETFKNTKQSNRRSGRENQWTPVRKNGNRKRKRTDLTNELLYYQRSPNFCERDVVLSLPGTHGRICNYTIRAGDTESCSLLCCGRGYNLMRKVTRKKCNCKFIWCCRVECQTCVVEEWISVCK